MGEINYSEIFDDYNGSIIPKTNWLNSGMTQHMKKIFNSFYKTSKLICSIPIYKNELIIIEVMVNILSGKSEFSDIIHASMPYPILLILNLDNEWYKITVVSAHTKKNNPNRKVVDKKISTIWTDSDSCISILNKIKCIIYNTDVKSDIYHEIRESILNFNENKKIEIEENELIFKRKLIQISKDNNNIKIFLNELDIVIYNLNIANKTIGRKYDNDEKEQYLKHMMYLEMITNIIGEIVEILDLYLYKEFEGFFEKCIDLDVIKVDEIDYIDINYGNDKILIKFIEKEMSEIINIWDNYSCIDMLKKHISIYEYIAMQKIDDIYDYIFEYKYEFC